MIELTRDRPLAQLLGAIAFAAQKHRHQRRKDASSSPYINHPIEVAHLLASTGCDDLTTLQAAALHDTIEDTETSYEELAVTFGRPVADCVLEVTDDKSLAKDVRKREQVRSAPSMSLRAAAVKLADKTCNLRDLGNAPPADWNTQRRAAYFEWAKSVADALPGEHTELRLAFAQAHEAGCGAGMTTVQGG